MLGIGLAINRAALPAAFAELNLLMPTLDPRITFARASTKTYVGSNGLLQTAAVNACPLEYDPVTLLPVGRSFWEARTNTLLWSSDFTQSSWVKTALGAASVPVVTGNYAVAPDGTTSANRILFTLNGNTADTDQAFITQAQTTVTSSTYAQAVWLRSNDGANHLLQLSFNGSNPLIATVTPTWQRFTNVGVASDTLRGFRLGLRGSTTANLAADVLVWGAQQELAATSGPTIPTTTAQVTRAADVATVNDLSTLRFNAAQGTLYTEFVNPVNSGLRAASVLWDGTTNNRIEMRINGATSEVIEVAAGTTQGQPGIGSAPTGTVKTACAWDVASIRYARGGASAAAIPTTAIPVVTTLAVGSRGGGSTTFTNAPVRRVRYYPRKLSDAELQVLTT